MTARRVEEVAQEVPIPLSVVGGDLVENAGAFNVNRLKETDPDGAVLLDQPAQLGDQHPRPRRAVRPDQRRHRAGRRPLHRRRLLRAPGVGDARLPRRRADRSAARTAGHALRQEHHRRRDQRHDAQAELHARQPTSSSTSATSASCRPRRRSPARSAAEGRRARCRSRARSATARVFNTKTEQTT